jgi:hypothetical protein
MKRVSWQGQIPYQKGLFMAVFRFSSMAVLNFDLYFSQIYGYE